MKLKKCNRGTASFQKNRVKVWTSIHSQVVGLFFIIYLSTNSRLATLSKNMSGYKGKTKAKICL